MAPPRWERPRRDSRRGRSGTCESSSPAHLSVGLRSPFVERMRIRTLYHGFCGDRKGHPVLVLGGVGDFARAARFLAAKIVRGNADYRQASIVKLGPQILQPAILRRVAAQ